ncbi:hypothetical protein ACF053_30045 [Streptomyces kanasensis]|uniref:hypothetical protein n=1 Tax=Streptomyces kanasensis TaxID=936756 RepID=UPI0037031213
MADRSGPLTARGRPGQAPHREDDQGTGEGRRDATEGAPLGAAEQSPPGQDAAARPQAPVCAAAGRGCGTLTGWRNRGRCPACTEAHNAESRAWRARKNALPVDVVDRVVEQLSAGVPLLEAARRAGTTSKRVRQMAAITPRLAALLAEGEDRRLMGQVIDHLLALARGQDGDPHAGAWRLAVPQLADAELVMRKGPGALIRREEQQRVLDALAGGAPTLAAAADTVGVPASHVNAWTVQDARFATAVAGVQKAARDRLVAQALAELAADRDPEPVLKAAGRNMGWLRYQAKIDATVSRAFSDARQQRSYVRAAARTQAATVRPPTARRRPQPNPADDSTKAHVVQQDRKKLAALLPLLEEGATINRALETIGATAYWLGKARDRVPEADRMVKAAYEAGAGKRPVKQTVSDRVSRDARAQQLVVAALASGATLKQAAAQAGAAPSWVVRQYHRDDRFRHALLAAVQLNPDYDLHADMEDVMARQKGYVPSPRPPS